MLPSPADKKVAIKTGTPDHEDVNIVLRLYELRREDVMRRARNFILQEFHPKSLEDVIAVTNPSHPGNAFFRQVITYWEMCATFVNSGALHEELFWRTNGEALVAFSKIEPFLEELRAKLEVPDFLGQVEALVKRRPDGRARVDAIRARLEKMAAAAKSGR